MYLGLYWYSSCRFFVVVISTIYNFFASISVIESYQISLLIFAACCFFHFLNHKKIFNMQLLSNIGVSVMNENIWRQLLAFEIFEAILQEKRNLDISCCLRSQMSE